MQILYFKGRVYNTQQRLPLEPAPFVLLPRLVYSGDINKSDWLSDKTSTKERKAREAKKGQWLVAAWPLNRPGGVR